ncbi:MAG: DUF4446 family protein [Lachnospiraceae bacterium]|nr:DUF4446 family protein [Lachnospiraceae bacterium]
MNITNDLLNNIGIYFTNIDIGYILIAMAAIILIMFIIILIMLNQMKKIKRLKNRLDKFMLDEEGKSLEEDLGKIYNDNKFLKENAEQNKKDIRALYRNMEKAYQKMGLVKYDAFNQMGGQLSFSLALLNENNDGFIINSVHSTEGCYSYTKEIKAGECAISLGDEEKEALEMAMGI